MGNIASHPAAEPGALSATGRVLGWLVNPRGNSNLEALSRSVRGKVVLVTGASFGIGEATARRLAEAGAKVVMVARSRERLEQIAEEIRLRGGSACVEVADLTDIPQVEALASRVLSEHGHVDVLVSNAGKSIRRSIALSCDRFQDFERTMAVNYLGPVRLVTALLPSMRARRSGHIVNISTLGVRIPPGARWAAYQASKGAFDIWLRSVALEVRGEGVTVTSVYMALVFTRMSAPTPLFRRLPGMLPEGAAHLVSRAIISRPRTIAPWWLGSVEVLSVAFRTPVERLLEAVFRRTRDTAQALGVPRPESEMSGGLVRRSRDVKVLARAGLALMRAGVDPPLQPRETARMLMAVRRNGRSIATLAGLAAARYPDSPAVIDERGSITFRELAERVEALAADLMLTAGVGPKRGLAIMCRNHRYFIEALLAGARTGADLLLLNTEFPGPQLEQALAGQTIGAVIHDAEFASALDQTSFDGPRIVAWHEGTSALSLDELVTRARGKRPARRVRAGRIVILTAGTTGAPKGAPRAPQLLAFAGPLATLLTSVPFRARQPILVAPPLFHGFGLAFLALGLTLGAPLVLKRKFDAHGLLLSIDRHEVAVAIVVPTMLRAILELHEAVRDGFDLSSLRAVVSAGAPLPGTLASRFMETFGELLYNLYGSSEVGFASMAGPFDLRAAPGTVGRPPLGVELGILDESGAAVGAGQIGHVCVASPMVFGGYLSGGTKRVTRGLMDTGDLGHIDASGRLFIDGREDDMIVSGGENVYPGEIEDALRRHDAVADALVVGVADDRFGQRLEALVVLRQGQHVFEGDLKDHLKSILARYKIPRSIAFVPQLPMNAVGKVVRRGRAPQEPQLSHTPSLETRPARSVRVT